MNGNHAVPSSSLVPRRFISKRLVHTVNKAIQKFSPQCGETVYFPFILRLLRCMLRHFLLGYMRAHIVTTLACTALERMALLSTTGFTTEPDEFPVALSVAMSKLTLSFTIILICAWGRGYPFLLLPYFQLLMEYPVTVSIVRVQ